MDITRRRISRRRQAIAAVIAALALAALASQCKSAPDGPGDNSGLIGEARGMPPGPQVALAGKIVTRAFSDRYYISEPDRSAGVAVALLRSYVPGTIVDVQGTLSRTSGETVITAASDSVHGEVLPLAPLGASNRAAAGKLAEGQLVRVWGRVVQTGFGSAFRIDDGTGIEASGVIGLRIYKKSAFPSPPEGAFVSIIGARGQISGAFGDLPVVYISSADDVTVID